MSKSAGGIQRPEKLAYHGGLILLGLLGLLAAFFAALSQWHGAVACLSLAITMIGPVLFVQSRRQVRAFRTATRQEVATVRGAAETQLDKVRQALDSVPSGQTTRPKEAPVQTNRELVSLLARNNRQLLALSEQIGATSASPATAVGGAEADRLSAEVASLRAELAEVRAVQEDLRSGLEGGWAEARADLTALAGYASVAGQTWRVDQR